MTTSRFIKLALQLSVPMLLVGLGSVMTAEALTISPARMEMVSDPGQKTDGEFLLINEQDSDATFYTSVENFEAQGESGTPNFTTSKEGLASWVTVTDKVSIKKGERVKVSFSVNVPKDADAGGHFAAIFLSTVPPTQQGGSVSVGAKIGMLILFKVNGDIKEGGGIKSFILKDNVHVLTSLPANFVYRFTNNGNDRANPTGNIVVRDMIGLTAAKLNANPSLGNVLPNSTRRFDVVWGPQDGIPDSASFFEHVSYQFSNFAFGVYHAGMSLTFGTSGTSADSFFFVVFPWQLVIVILVILLILIIILRTSLRRYNKWIIKQARLHHGK
jgi:hypothetical protein